MLDICLWSLLFTHPVRKVWIKKMKSSNIERLASDSGYRTCAYIRITWRVVKTQIAQGHPKISKAVDLRWGPRICISQKGPDGADVIALRTTPWELLVYLEQPSHSEPGFTPMSVWFQNLCCLSWYELPHAVCPKWTLCLHISVPSLPLGSPSGYFHPSFMTQPNVSTSRKYFFFSEGADGSSSVFPGSPMQKFCFSLSHVV